VYGRRDGRGMEGHTFGFCAFGLLEAIVYIW
jgi:hypothetical protein